MPIVTFHGPGGGIELLPGWRTALGGIGADHGAGLLLAGHPLLARGPRPGGPPRTPHGRRCSPRSRRPTGLGSRPSRNGSSSTRLPHRGSPWTPRCCRTAARAAREHLALELTTPEGTRALQPAGLLLRGGRSFLVVPPDDETEVAQVLPLDTVTAAPAAAGTCPRRDSNPHSSAFKAPASAVGLRGLGASLGPAAGPGPPQARPLRWSDRTSPPGAGPHGGKGPPRPADHP